MLALVLVLALTLGPAFVLSLALVVVIVLALVLVLGPASVLDWAICVVDGAAVVAGAEVVIPLPLATRPRPRPRPEIGSPVTPFVVGLGTDWPKSPTTGNKNGGGMGEACCTSGGSAEAEAEVEVEVDAAADADGGGGGRREGVTAAGGVGDTIDPAATCAFAFVPAFGPGTLMLVSPF